MDSQTKSRLTTGLLLIILGLGAYGYRLAGDLGESLLLMAAGGLFVGGYLMTRSAFLVIVGCLLFGVGLGSFGQEKEFFVVGRFTTMSLGIGFILIYVVRMVYERRSHWWPLIPGSILVLLGLRRWGPFWRFLVKDGWPLILVILGVLVLLGALGTGRNKKQPDDGERGHRHRS